MTEHLQLALRRYKEIAPKPFTDWLDVPRTKLKVWLADDVCTSLESYWNRPKFREFAAWSIRSLAPNANSPERRLIENVDSALVANACKWLKLAANQWVRFQLKLLNRPREEQAEVGTSTSGRNRSRSTVTDDFAILQKQVRNISKRFWTDLVCPDDYLYPFGGWMERRRIGPAMAGEFVLNLNPKLHAIGDFVARCLLIRVEELYREMESFRQKCVAAEDMLAHKHPALRRVAEESSATLRAAVKELQIALKAGEESRLRDSCVILAQVYLAFHSDAVWQWLPLREDVVSSGRARVCSGLEHAANSEMFDRIAAAISDLMRLYEGDAPNQSAIEEAVATGGLVLTRDQKVYWDRTLIDVEWQKHRTSRRLLFQLASKARFGAAVGERDVYDDAMSESTMANAILRLNDLLPATLSRQIKPAGNREYRLDLSSSNVHVFD